jgi:hypothetical protein
MSYHQQALRGVIEDGQIRLFEQTSIPDGTLVEVTINVPTPSEQAQARQRQLLSEGIRLGGPPYPAREELHLLG